MQGLFTTGADDKPAGNPYEVACWAFPDPSKASLEGSSFGKKLAAAAAASGRAGRSSALQHQYQKLYPDAEVALAQVSLRAKP